MPCTRSWGTGAASPRRWSAWARPPWCGRYEQARPLLEQVVPDATTSRPSCRVGWRWRPSRPIGPRTGSGSCISTSNAARAGWRPTRSSAPSIDRSCGPWPVSDGPPVWPSKPTGPAMSWRCSARCRGRPGAGGPGARPPPSSRTTGTPTRSPTRTGPWALRPATRRSGPTDSGPHGLDRVQANQRAPTTAATPHRSANAPSSRDLATSVAGTARSEPPANTRERQHPMASSRSWPFDDEDRVQWVGAAAQPGRSGGHLGHLTSDPDELLVGTDADRPVVAVRVRATVGRPGGSAQARWRQLRWPSARPGSGPCPGGSPPSLGSVAGWGCGFGPARRSSPGVWGGGGAAYRSAALAAGAARLGGPGRPGRPP